MIMLKKWHGNTNQHISNHKTIPLTPDFTTTI